MQHRNEMKNFKQKAMEIESKLRKNNKDILIDKVEYIISSSDVSLFRIFNKLCSIVFVQCKNSVYFSRKAPKCVRRKAILFATQNWCFEGSFHVIVHRMKPI